MKKCLAAAVLAAASIFALAPDAASSDGARGKAVYEKRCSWCHGKDGKGDGPAVQFLSPAPRDFTSGVYKWKSTPYDEMVPSKQDFYRMIAGTVAHTDIGGWGGLNGTSMPGWADVLTKAELDDVAAYIKSFAMFGNPEKPPIDTTHPVKPTAQGLERGKKLFKDRCTECHGEEGRGNTSKKLKDDWGGRTWPRDLSKGWTFRAGNTPQAIYTRITAGIAGTQMPSFADPVSKKKLTEDERWDVANYVQALDAPYKKPGSSQVVQAFYTAGELPKKPLDAAWGSARYTSFYTAPQIVAGDRLFKPTVDSVSVKAIYNDSGIALLLEWDDPTRSIPGDQKSIEIADGDVLEDSAAVEFPASFSREEDKPYFGMGSPAAPVNIWQWKSGGAAAPSETVRLLNSRGFAAIEEKNPAMAGLRAYGDYDNGTWRVVFTRPLRTQAAEDDLQFEEDRFIPVAFAVWDGSNGDKGSRHVMTTWQKLQLSRGRGAGRFLWPVAAVIAVFAAEALLVISCRRG